MQQRVLHLEIHCRRAGDDAVEVVRIALCLDQGFAPAVRAPTEIGIRRSPVVEGFDQCFRSPCGEVHTAVGEIGALLRIGTEGPAIALMTHVGTGYDEAAAFERYAACDCVRSQRNAAAQPAAADLQEALGPAIQRQLHAKADARCQRAFDIAYGGALISVLYRCGRDATTASADRCEVEREQ